MAGQALGLARTPAVLAGARWHGRGAFVLTYHDVTDDPANPTDTLTPARLREQLRAIRRLGVELVDLADLAGRALAGERVDRLAAVAFDDAFRGVHRDALPVLVDLAVPATVFVVSERLGTDDPDWYPGADRTMTKEELLEVVDAGVSVGSHTRTHVPLFGLDRSTLDDELAGSRATLEDLTGRPVDLFAYPGGYYDPSARVATADAGYAAAFTFSNGRLHPHLDRFRLPRLSMGSHWRAPHLAYMLARPSWSFREHQVETVAP
jgi:peptidoglycan/xylan/chitin deacetylase (PgdA/CDA1 family)